MTPRLKLAAALLISLAVSMAAWALYQHHQTAVVSQQLQEARQLHQKALQQLQAYAVDSGRVQALEGQVEALVGQRKVQDRRVADLEARLKTQPVPPAPGPAPTSDPELAQGLRELGTHPTFTAEALAFPKPEGGTLWTWGKQAQRVPALEARLSTSEALTGGLKDSLATSIQQVSLLSQQKVALQDGTVHLQAAYDDERQAREKAESAAVRAEHQLKVSTLPWNVGASYGLKDQSWGLWATRKITFVVVGAEVVRTPGVPGTTIGPQLDGRLMVGFSLP